MDVSEEKLRRKTLAQDVFDRRWNLDGVKTLIKKYQCKIFNFSLIFAVGWALCGGPQPEHESMMPLLSLPPLNVQTH